MCLLPYSHYVAVFFCFGLFIADCVLILRKRSELRIIISYFLGALLFLPWLYFMLVSRSISNFGSFWPKVPAFKDIMSVCKWLAGAQSVMDIPFWLTLCGMFFVLRQAYKLLATHETFSTEIIFLCACIFSSAFMILSVFIYSRFINPGGSFFVIRYFMPVLPVVCLLMSYGTEYIYDHLEPVFGNAARCALIFFMLFFLVLNFSKITEHNFYIHEPYREVTSLIYDKESQQSGIGSAAVLTTDGYFVYDGWKELYFSNKQDKTIPAYCMNTPKATLTSWPDYIGKRHNEPTPALSEITEILKKAKYDRIYLCYLHAPLDSKQEWQPILNWLHENYRFGEKVKDYNFQILTRKQ